MIRQLSPAPDKPPHKPWTAMCHNPTFREPPGVLRSRSQSALKGWHAYADNVCKGPPILTGDRTRGGREAIRTPPSSRARRGGKRRAPNRGGGAWFKARSAGLQGHVNPTTTSIVFR